MKESTALSQKELCHEEEHIEDRNSVAKEEKGTHRIGAETETVAS